MAPAPVDSGLGTQYEVPYTNALVILSFLTIAWYNVAELTVLIHSFFKRHSGFYYWSLHVANLGIFFHGLGMFLKFYRINEGMKGHAIANTVIVWLGWIAMVTGQSIVLWSRMHLVVKAAWIKWVLVMIIVDGVVLHLPTGVFTFLTNLAKDPEQWKGVYSIIERIQVTGFFLQEVILSGIYIWKTWALLKMEGPLFNRKKNARGDRGRKVLVHTIVMSFIIVILDITLLALEFSGLYDIQTSYKGAVYSVKLKMEFTILNQLMNLVKGNLSESHSTPYTGSRPPAFSRSGVRNSVRPPQGTELGHTAGAYSRMDDGMPPTDDIKLQNMKANDVWKTTTTEVRVDQIDKINEDSESIGERKRPSASSSEQYIMASTKD